MEHSTSNHKHKKHKHEETDNDNGQSTKEMKLMKKLSSANYDKRLIVILVNASLETVKVGKVFYNISSHLDRP